MGDRVGVRYDGGTCGGHQQVIYLVPGRGRAGDVLLADLGEVLFRIEIEPVNVLCPFEVDLSNALFDGSRVE